MRIACYIGIVRSLTKAEILAALSDLNAELAEEADRIEIMIVGGAAMVLLYGARDSTRDVDALFVTSRVEAVRAAARRAALKRGLPPDWLNDGAKGFLHGISEGPELVVMDKLIVRSVSPHQLLAMKLAAWRDDVDISDARLLLAQMNGSRAEVWESLKPYLLPGRELKARYAFDDLWESIHGSA